MQGTRPAGSADSRPGFARLPRRLGRYELLGELAAGGMGVVALARAVGHGGFQRLYAVKVPLPELASDPQAAAMLLDEARIAARIHHPNVVATHEVGQSPEAGYYLVMDYVEGFALHLLVQRAPADDAWPRLALRVMVDALEGLGAAHAAVDEAGAPLSVVHRDVSPQNVLVGADGIARVTDFGIAKAADRLARTRVGHIKGKLAYMAPEQALGEFVDARADVFAAGVVLWELLTRARLFQRESDAAVLSALLDAPIPQPSSVSPGVSAALDAVCARALQREAYLRYASAGEMAVALEAAAAGALASRAEVARVVRGCFGPELAARRALVQRAASEGATPEGVASATTASATAASATAASATAASATAASATAASATAASATETTSPTMDVTGSAWTEDDAATEVFAPVEPGDAPPDELPTPPREPRAASVYTADEPSLVFALHKRAEGDVAAQGPPRGAQRAHRRGPPVSALILAAAAVLLVAGVVTAWLALAR